MDRNDKSGRPLAMPKPRWVVIVDNGVEHPKPDTSTDHALHAEEVAGLADFGCYVLAGKDSQPGVHEGAA